MPPAPRDTIVTALALALGSAVSLGLARFSYALLLPAMRADLGWSYFTAGAMNTLNAAGYLLGALLAPRLMARHGARAVLVAGGVLAALGMAGHALVRADAALYAMRLATGVASAFSFVAGGLMAARLGSQLDAGSRITPGLVLGIYYGGTGLGIVACALLLPPVLAAPADWPRGWWWLAALCLAATALMAWRARVAEPAPAAAAQAQRVGWGAFGFGLAGYFMFGLGYIGYMTFIVTLLREQGLDRTTIAAFYALLGLGVIASPWLWAALLQRARGRRRAGHAVGAAGAGHRAAGAAAAGGAGLRVGRAVRRGVPLAGGQHHRAGSAQPAAGAVGARHRRLHHRVRGRQIVGPSLVGRLADGGGGLRAGLAWSAGALALGALLAWRQRPLARA